LQNVVAISLLVNVHTSKTDLQGSTQLNLDYTMAGLLKSSSPLLVLQPKFWFKYNNKSK